ncbi:MAG: hypothetical protein DDG60_03435 [Anaerolineae bacterium]|nr:MAG: hypothetical protein DDG60_03435 [Anaerolineae bacterium]
MRRAISSLLGTLLLVTALTGISISIYGIIGLWHMETEFKLNLLETLALVDTTLQTTSDGLAVAARALEQADSALASLTQAVEAAGNSVENTLPVIDTLSTVTTRELPQTISQSQQAIQAAQNSARIIDSTLAALASIPLIGLRGYDSSRPLSEALAELSKSLDPISSSLRSMEESLNTSRNSLSNIGSNTDEIANNLTEIRNSLAQSQQVIAEYTQVVKTLHEKIKTTQKTLPKTLDQATWFISIALAWLGLTQIGLFIQGLQMLGVEISTPRANTSQE